MTYEVEVYDINGKDLGFLSHCGNIASARQAMLDHAGVADLPTEEPFETAYLGGDVIEGWFIGQIEYHIIRRRKAGR